MSLDIAEMLGGSINRISHVNRYSSVPVIRRENVAEHSFFVAFYSLVIGRDLDRKGYTIDFGELLSRALVHDLDESMTGDFLRYVKYGHPKLKKVLDEVSASMIEQMIERLGVDLKDDWELAKADDIEGHIVQVVDLARVASYVWEEVRSGNSHIYHILEECRLYISSLIEELGKSPMTIYAKDICNWICERQGLHNSGIS